jgi:hypothetical protein
MEVSEKWGHRADSLVACLMAGCALAVAIYGIAHTCYSYVVLPYLWIFFSLEMVWLAWIIRSLVILARDGHFSPAAGHVAMALPLATLSILSILVTVPSRQAALLSPMMSDRLFEHLLRALHWWIEQC